MIYVRQTYVLLSHRLVCEFNIALFMSARYMYYYQVSF